MSLRRRAAGLLTAAALLLSLTTSPAHALTPAEAADARALATVRALTPELDADIAYFRSINWGFDEPSYDPAVCVPGARELWLDERMKTAWSDDEIEFTVRTQVIGIASTEASMTGAPDAPVFGRRGEYTKRMLKTDRVLDKLWKVGDYRLAPVHSRTVLDARRTAPVLQVLFPDRDAAWARKMAAAIAEYADRPAFEYGNDPAFSFGAWTMGPVTGEERVIVMGDGIIDGYTRLGHGAIAVETILAHERWHAVAMDTGLITTDDLHNLTPRSNTIIELEADAASAYALGAKKGLSLNHHRFDDDAFGAGGGCHADQNNFHGTSAQRAAAGQWGYDLSRALKPKGKALTPTQFRSRYTAEVPRLLAVR